MVRLWCGMAFDALREWYLAGAFPCLSVFQTLLFELWTFTAFEIDVV